MSKHEDASWMIFSKRYSERYNEVPENSFAGLGMDAASFVVEAVWGTWSTEGDVIRGYMRKNRSNKTTAIVLDSNSFSGRNDSVAIYVPIDDNVEFAVEMVPKFSDMKSE